MVAGMFGENPTLSKIKFQKSNQFKCGLLVHKVDPQGPAYYLRIAFCHAIWTIGGGGGVRV